MLLVERLSTPRGSTDTVHQCRTAVYPQGGQQVLSCKAAHRHVSKTHPTCNIKINKILTLYFKGHQSDSTGKRKNLLGAHGHRTSRGFYCDWLLIQQVTKLFILLQILKLLDFFYFRFWGLGCTKNYMCIFKTAPIITFLTFFWRRKMIWCH